MFVRLRRRYAFVADADGKVVSSVGQLVDGMDVTWAWPVIDPQDQIAGRARNDLLEGTVFAYVMADVERTR